MWFGEFNKSKSWLGGYICNSALFLWRFLVFG